MPRDHSGDSSGVAMALVGLGRVLGRVDRRIALSGCSGNRTRTDRGAADDPRNHRQDGSHLRLCLPCRIIRLAAGAGSLPLAASLRPDGTRHGYRTHSMVDGADVLVVPPRAAHRRRIRQSWDSDRTVGNVEMVDARITMTPRLAEAGGSPLPRTDSGTPTRQRTRRR